MGSTDWATWLIPVPRYQHLFLGFIFRHFAGPAGGPSHSPSPRMSGESLMGRWADSGEDASVLGIRSEVTRCAQFPFAFIVNRRKQEAL